MCCLEQGRQAVWSPSALARFRPNSAASSTRAHLWQRLVQGPGSLRRVRLRVAASRRAAQALQILDRGLKSGGSLETPQAAHARVHADMRTRGGTYSDVGGRAPSIDSPCKYQYP
ncbi:hypothetical protein WJX74_007268 [Apatococcus lobatus]|uniref:Uncharacterized protein n=1 Tax=Apatococcus lobatus TaxID=904363 RepID=A0AAW1R0W7_9CHLO